MWHASASAHRHPIPVLDLERICYELLGACGDVLAGEWKESGGQAFHLRRRLSASEAALVGPVVDIRGTPEAERRMRPVASLVPGWLIEEELGRVSPTLSLPLEERIRR